MLYGNNEQYLTGPQKLWGTRENVVLFRIIYFLHYLQFLYFPLIRKKENQLELFGKKCNKKMETATHQPPCHFYDLPLTHARTSTRIFQTHTHFYPHFLGVFWLHLFCCWAHTYAKLLELYTKFFSNTHMHTHTHTCSQQQTLTDSKPSRLFALFSFIRFFSLSSCASNKKIEVGYPSCCCCCRERRRWRPIFLQRKEVWETVLEFL